MHSDVSDPQNDTCLIFKSSPYGSVSHSHADQNAFAIMKGGVALAIPSGHYGPSYGKPHHAEWTRSTKANNCILVDGQGQTIRLASANGQIIDFQDAPGYSYVAGDATNAYMGKLKKWIRRILFLRPGFFLLLDEIEAPTQSQYQWMFHAFEKMDIRDQRITSRRKNATLNAYLACIHEMALSQTNQFDTPYNHGIPKAYHQEKSNHWHVTAATQEKSQSTRIAAIMTVTNTNEQCDIKLQKMNGWFGLKASGDFGRAEGWIRIDNVESGPVGFDPQTANGKANLCGRSRDGVIFSD